MFSYIIRRILLFIPVLVGISIAVFLLIHLIPGNVVDSMLGIDATDELREQLTKDFGLDKPLIVQYKNWATSLLKGDFGISYRTKREVLPEILSRFKVSFELSMYASVIAWLIAIPMGIIAAVKRNTIFDAIARFLSLIWVSVPNFALATIVLLVLSLQFSFYPPLKYVSFLENPIENFKVMIFPALVLGAIMSGSVMRMTRSAMLEVLNKDFIKTIKAKGARKSRIIFKHALKNSLLPIVTIIGMQIGYLLGGTVITEKIFSLPGLGLYTLTGITQRDYAVVQGSILFFAFAFVIVNLIVDIMYTFIDPRIKY